MTLIFSLQTNTKINLFMKQYHNQHERQQTYYIFTAKLNITKKK